MLGPEKRRPGTPARIRTWGNSPVGIPRRFCRTQLLMWVQCIGMLFSKGKQSQVLVRSETPPVRGRYIMVFLEKQQCGLLKVQVMTHLLNTSECQWFTAEVGEQSRVYWLITIGPWVNCKWLNISVCQVLYCVIAPFTWLHIFHYECNRH